MTNNRIKFIFIPGLGDDWMGFIKLTKQVCEHKYQSEYKANFYIHRMQWRHSPEAVLHQFNKLSKIIEKSDNQVILCGISAGATPALLLTMMHPDKVQSVITFGGWLQYTRFIRLARNNAFQNFVHEFSKVYLASSKQDQQQLLSKVICINPKKDWLIPSRARKFPGENQPETITLPFYEHHGVTTIGLLSTFARGKNKLVVEEMLNGNNHKT